MASKPSIYSDGDIRVVKWTFMMKRVAPLPLRFILQNEMIDKQDQESPLDFFKRKNKKLKFLYKADEIKLGDPSISVEDLDITLLYKVIRHGNFKLAVDDEKWKVGDNHIESLITRVKDLRNELYHEDFPFSEKEFEDRTEMLKELLTDILQCAESTYTSDTSQMILEIHKNINEYRNANVEDDDHSSYRFDKLCERVRTEGKENVKRQYYDMGATVVNTVNHIIELSSPVEDIFSDMELKISNGNKENISYEEILKGLRYDTSDPIISLEGEAGVGKTTIVKKIISDWMSDIQSLKELQSFDLILHHECRNAFIKDYDRLLEEKMPDIAKDLTEGELRRATLNVRSMIILDGLDELNDASTVLFEEILEMKEKYGITVVVTSRPEQNLYLRNKLKLTHMKYISILGIPLNQRKTFVEKYHHKLTEIEKRKGTVNVPAIEDLISCMEDTQICLSNVWRFPHNLTFLTILYFVRHTDLQKITTATELYREIIWLYYTRLLERLSHSQETKSLQESEAERKIEIFLHALTKESIIGLMKDQINLQHEAYTSLKEVCIYISIPAEQMIGAFLEKVPSTSSLIVYGYPHKGIQDYLSAQYVWMLLSGEYQSAEIHKAIGDVFDAISKHSLSPHICHGIMGIIEREMKRKQSSITGKTSFDAVRAIKDTETVLAMNNVPQNKIEQISQSTAKILQDKESSASFDLANIHSTLIKKLFLFSRRTETLEEENLPKDSVVVENQASAQESTIIRDILQDIYTECFQDAAQRQTTQHQSISAHGSTSHSDDDDDDDESGFEINKFQNMLLCLLGMFNTEGKIVQDNIKLEALKLLEETGVKDRDAWLNVLCNVKCDAFVASFIARQKDILQGYVKIDDASLFPYISLMKSLENSLENARNIKIHLDIKQLTMQKDLFSEIKRLQFEVYDVIIADVNIDIYLTVLKELKEILSSDHKINISSNEVSSKIMTLLCDVNSLDLNVTKLHLRTHFRNPAVCDLQWQAQINQIMKRCPVERYMGSMMTEMSFSPSLISLYVSVTTKEEMERLNSFIIQSHTLEFVDVCVSADVDHRNFIPIHEPRNCYPSLFIVNVEVDNVENSVNIIKSLQPLNGKKIYWTIYFPRCNINPLDLIKSMGSMGIQSFSLCFPSSLKPKKQRELVEEEADKKLGCCYISWGGKDFYGHSIDDW